VPTGNTLARSRSVSRRTTVGAGGATLGALVIGSNPSTLQLPWAKRTVIGGRSLT
jgi:hypothetical protein